VSIYEINGLPGLPITARVQIPNGTGVEFVPGSFNISPTEVIAGVDFDMLVWDLTLTGQAETITWHSTVSDMQPGESRAVTLVTTVDFGFQGTPGQVQLPSQSVISEQVLALDPASQTVRPGEAAEFTVTIANPAQIGVTYALAVAGVSLEWVEFPTQVTVPAGGSVDLDLTITSDPFATEATFGFVVTASAGAVSGSVAGTLNLVGDPVLPNADPEAHGVVVALAPSQATAGQGTAATYVVRVTNTGSAPETFDLSESGLPAAFAVSFTVNGLATSQIEVPPGADNFREVSLAIVPPLGTLANDYAFDVSVVSTTHGTVSDTAGAVVKVLAIGVDAVITPASGAPASAFQLRVTNTGQSTETFDLSLAAPVALVATLGASSVTLGAGESQAIAINMGAIDFAVPGNLLLAALAKSRSNSEIQDMATADVTIAATHGMTAEFEPGTQTLPAPGESIFVLNVENTGNTEEEFMATIAGTNGPVSATLIGLDGLPAQSISSFRLPGLFNGAIVLKTLSTAVGLGTIDVQVKSLGTGNQQTVRAAAIVQAATPPGVSVEPTNGLVTTEQGGQATFAVVLQSIPTSDVTITLLSSDASEGTVSPLNLVFTPQNALVPQTVTVTGVGDSADDGDIAYHIATAASSADTAYQGIAVADVSVTNLDNDVTEETSCTAPFHTGNAEGDGNVSARVKKQKLSLRGDSRGNAIHIEAEGDGSYVVTGLDGTTVNRETGPVRFRGVRGLDIGMGSGDDIVFFGPVLGQTGRIDRVLEDGLSIRMDAGDDELTLCGLEISGRTKIGSGLGSDRYTIDDAEFLGPAAIGTGNAGDTIRIDTQGDPEGPPTVFHAQSSIRGKDGDDNVQLGRNGEPGNSVRFRDFDDDDDDRDHDRDRDKDRNRNKKKR
jgi:hypothetical protein